MTEAKNEFVFAKKDDAKLAFVNDLGQAMETLSKHHGLNYADTIEAIASFYGVTVAQSVDDGVSRANADEVFAWHGRLAKANFDNWWVENRGDPT